ncbi:hypothetical protein ACFQ0B_49280 [Nonomuraea thailandensis]
MAQAARAYRRFLEESLPAGATLVVPECGLRWPVTRVGPRYVFQHGRWAAPPGRSTSAAARAWPAT